MHVTSCNAMASKRQLKQLTIDDVRKKNKRDDVAIVEPMESSYETYDSGESQYSSDECEYNDESDRPESDDDSDCFTAVASNHNEKVDLEDSDGFEDGFGDDHINASSICYNDNSFSIDQHSNSTASVTIINNQSLVPNKSNCTTSLPASTSTCGSHVAPSDIAASPNQSPIQPILQYPVTIIGGKRRSFNPLWYKKYHWLEYSQERDAVYCFPCRFFGTCNGLGRGTNTFSQVGFVIGNMPQDTVECW